MSAIALYDLYSISDPMGVKTMALGMSLNAITFVILNFTKFFHNLNTVFDNGDRKGILPNMRHDKPPNRD
jgi:hypothetical protein